MRSRRTVASAATIAWLLAVPVGGAVQADEPEDLGPGCDPDRAAIAHLEDAVVLDPQPDDGPVPCGMRTGFPGGETRIEVTNTGAVIYAPAGHQPEPQTTMHGRGGVAVSHDQGATWELSLPLGMTWHQNDQETHVDRDTGRFFWAVMFKNGPGQVPTTPGETPWDDIDDDELPASHFYALPRGQPDTDNLAAAVGLPVTSHILTSPDEGKTWTYGTTPGEIVNGAALFTARPPEGTEQPDDYPNVAYYCWRASQTIGRAVEGHCARSLDGGGTWEFRGWTHRPIVPVHAECPTPSTYSPFPDERTESAGLPVPAPDGTLYMVVGCGGQTYLSRSVDQAATWSVVGELPHRGELKIDTAGNMYLMRALTDPHRLLLSVSVDGRTWSREMNVTAPGVTFFERETTALYGGLSCCTNWFYDVREPGHVAVAYSARGDDQGTTLDGYVTATRNALDVLSPGGQPVFWSAAINPPDRPLKFHTGFPRGANGSRGPLPGSASGLGGPQTNQVGMDIGPDGSPWASFTEDCGPSPEDPRCEAQNWQTRGFAGRLAWPDEQ